MFPAACIIIIALSLAVIVFVIRDIVEDVRDMGHDDEQPKNKRRDGK